MAQDTASTSGASNSQDRVLSSTLSRQWSSEIISAEHIDLQATAMGLDCSGQLVLLGGKKYLGLVKLDYETPTLEVTSKLNRPTTKWEACKISWNPDIGSKEVVGMAWNDRVELFKVQPHSIASMDQLRFHSRVITDFDWSYEDPNVLASASLDSLVYQWDIREPSTPVLTLNGMVPITHVRWNRHNPHHLATTHEGEVKIWDNRRLDMPTRFISMQSSRILSLDWSRNSAHKFVTSGQDCTVKCFDLATDHKNPKKVLKTAAPVLRARYTPFGEGLATVIIPQLHRNDNTLFLWNSQHLQSPVHCFFGHKDVILDFDWRRLEGSDDMEMITWSRDHTLRLWQVPVALQNQCGGKGCSTKTSVSNESDCDEKEDDDINNYEEKHDNSHPPPLEPQDSFEEPDVDKTLTRSGGLELLKEEEEQQQQLQNNLDTAFIVPSRESTPLRQLERKNSSILAQEFQSLDMSRIKYITIENLDWARRTCRLSASFLGKITFHKIFLRITFQRDYPLSCPMFAIGRGTTLDSASKASIVDAMKMTAGQHVRRNLICLEPCLLQLEALIDQMRKGGGGESFTSSSDILSMRNSLPGQGEALKKNTPPPNPFPLAVEGNPEMLEGDMGNLPDSNVPYPKLSGARFCSNDLLVCFCQTDSMSKMVRSSPGNTLILTPRALPAFETSYHLTQQLDIMNGMRPMNARSGQFRQSPSKYQSSSSNLTCNSSSSSLVGLKHAGESGSLKTTGRFNICRVRSGSTEDVKGPLSRRPSNTAAPIKDCKIDKGSVGAKVAVYNISDLMPFRKSLAQGYFLPHGPLQDRKRCCLENAKLAAKESYVQRATVWNICGQMMDKIQHKSNKNEIPWAVHPLGRPLLEKMIQNLLVNWDIQTAALVVCFFKPFNPPKSRIPPAVSVTIHQSPVVPKPLSPRRQASLMSPLNEPRGRHSRSPSWGQRANTPWYMRPGALPAHSSNSPYHTIHISSTTTNEGASNTGLARIFGNTPTLGSQSNLEQYFSPNPRESRSNSWSEAKEEEVEVPSPALSEEVKEDVFMEQAEFSDILDPAKSIYHDRLKLGYANVLQNWGLLIERCALLKNLNKMPSQRHIGLEMTVNCDHCGLDSGFQSQCSYCFKFKMRCSICQLFVKGLALNCQACGHGGHMIHWQQWFQDQRECPTGCGCACSDQSQ